MVATKAALSIRVDALTDIDGKSESVAPSIGLENRAKLESRLRALEYADDLNGQRPLAKKQPRYEASGQSKVYNTAADAIDMLPTDRDPTAAAMNAVLEVKAEKAKEKEERKKKKEHKAKDETRVDGESPNRNGSVSFIFNNDCLTHSPSGWNQRKRGKLGRRRRRKLLQLLAGFPRA
jgi:nucleolar protein 58